MASVLTRGPKCHLAAWTNDKIALDHGQAYLPLGLARFEGLWCHRVVHRDLVHLILVGALGYQDLSWLVLEPGGPSDGRKDSVGGHGYCHDIV